jgi:hypothetical protein
MSLLLHIQQVPASNLGPESGCPNVFAASIIRAIIALMMEAANTSETSVNVYQTTQCNNPEDSYLHTRRLENLKSHLGILFLLS